jgi:hypothetical protein
MATIAPSRKPVTLINVFTVGQGIMRAILLSDLCRKSAIQEGFGVS